MHELVLKDGMVVGEDGIRVSDIIVADGKILELPEHFQGEAQEIIDCSGKYILPGCIDVHVHFRTPGDEDKEDWETGSKAAASSGVTMVFDMPNNRPPILDDTTLQLKREIVRGKSWVNYAFYIGATNDNIDQLNRVSGVRGVKIYMASSTGNLLVADRQRLEEIFKRVSGTIFCVHAESEEFLQHLAGVSDPSMHSKLRPPGAALNAVEFVLQMSEKYQRQVHICHVSTAAEVELLRSKKTKLVSCEVTPHHLFLDESAYSRLGMFAKVNPPLREAFDREAVFQGLKEGVIDMVATDHAPHLIVEKQQAYDRAPAGMPGLETMLPLLLNEVHGGRMTLEDVVRITSFNPAQRFGLIDRGEIACGKAADLVIVDCKEKRLVQNDKLITKCGWSAFDGLELFGWPVITVVNGNIVYKHGEFIGKPQGIELLKG